MARHTTAQSIAVALALRPDFTKNDKPSKLYSSTSMVDHEPTFTWWRMLEADAHQEWWLDLQA